MTQASFGHGRDKGGKMDTSIQKRVRRGNHLLVQSFLSLIGTGEGGHSHTGLAVYIYPDLKVRPRIDEYLSSARIEGRVQERPFGEGPRGASCWLSLQGRLKFSLDHSHISDTGWSYPAAS